MIYELSRATRGLQTFWRLQEDFAERREEFKSSCRERRRTASGLPSFEKDPVTRHFAGEIP